MISFLDLMRQAQGGQAIDNLAAAYGLKRREFETLMGTLLPVFALGMRKSVADMASPASVADLVDPAKFRAAYEDTSAAVSPAATEAGRIALQKLFGSGDAADVIARQASAVTGLGADVVSRVLPAMTATLFGGIAKELESTPLAPLMKGFSAEGATASLGALGNPVRDAMGAFLKGYAEGRPGTAPSGEGVKWPAGMETFGRMFEAGVEFNDAGRKAFDQWLGGGKD